MHCHPIIFCFVKIQIGLTFLVPAYQVALEKMPLNGCLQAPDVVLFSIWFVGRTRRISGHQHEPRQKGRVYRGVEQIQPTCVDFSVQSMKMWRSKYTCK